MQQSDIRSFGRRRGRKPSPAQQRLLSDVLPKVALDLKKDGAERVASQFSHQVDEIWLEIGFGGGEHLSWQAQHNPQVGIFGCEPFEDGVVKVLRQIEDQDLSNLRIYMDDARDVLRWLPESSVSRVFILFPDPWPKLRHRKRRLVNTELIGQVARVLKRDGELRLGTDIADYARAMLVALHANDRFRWLARSPTCWRVRPDDWPQTRYEQKALREGRRCSFLRWRKK